MPKPHSVMIYGESGDTKTSQIYHAFKYYHAKTGKRGRLITADGGGDLPFHPKFTRAYWMGTPSELRLEIVNKDGVVDVFDVSNTSNLGFSTIRKLSQGYWPNWVNGQAVFGAFQECLPKATGADQVGCVMVEGTTAICDLWLRGLTKRTENMGFKASYTIIEDNEVISGLQEGHYGIAQRELQNIIVEGFQTLAIDLLLFTGRVATGAVKRSGESVYGPKGAGQAMTSEIPSWFMDTLHLETVQATNGGGQPIELKVAWFQNHLDPQTKIRYLAKSRVSPECYEELLGAFQYPGCVVLDYNKGLSEYFRVLDGIMERQKGV